MNYHPVFQIFRKLHGTKNEVFHLGFLLVNVTNVMESNGKLHFLCSIGIISAVIFRIYNFINLK